MKTYAMSYKAVIPATLIKWVGATLFIVAFVLALPLLLPFALLVHSRYRHRLRSAAAEQSCSVCGALLGNESLDESDRRSRAHAAQLRRDFPGVRFRLERPDDAVCVVCGAAFKFEEASGTFVPALHV